VKRAGDSPSTENKVVKVDEEHLPVVAAAEKLALDTLDHKKRIVEAPNLEVEARMAAAAARDSNSRAVGCLRKGGLHLSSLKGSSS